MLCGAKRLDHTSRIFYNLCILKVPDIIELRIGIICLRHITIYCQRMHNSFSVSTNLFMQPDKFTQKFACTNMKSMSLSIKGVQLWNSLDSSKKFCQNVHLFKKIIKLKFVIVIYLICNYLW